MLVVTNFLDDSAALRAGFDLTEATGVAFFCAAAFPDTATARLGAFAGGAAFTAAARFAGRPAGAFFAAGALAGAFFDAAPDPDFFTAMALDPFFAVTLVPAADLTVFFNAGALPDDFSFATLTLADAAAPAGAADLPRAGVLDLV